MPRPRRASEASSHATGSGSSLAVSPVECALAAVGLPGNVLAPTSARSSRSTPTGAGRAGLCDSFGATPPPSATTSAAAAAAPAMGCSSGAPGASGATSDTAAAVKVFVRVRPFNEREAAAGDTLPTVRITAADPANITVLDPQSSHKAKETHTFERCFWSIPATGRGSIELPAESEAGSPARRLSIQNLSASFARSAPPPPFSSQADVYEHVGRGVLGNALEGYNGCIFAYGQTSSGKTYTMMGDITPLRAAHSALAGRAAGGSGSGSGGGLEAIVSAAASGGGGVSSEVLGDLPGIIPRLGFEVFEQLRTRRGSDSSVSFKVECQYFEIYNEKVFDLVCPENNEELRVRQDPLTGPFIEFLSTHTVTNESHIFELIRKGTAERHTAATRMNERSSRSHAILTLILTQNRIDAENNTTRMSSKLNLVDLAGSERTSASGVDGVHFREATRINLSLTTLGRVIDSLADSGSGKSAMKPPYRESLLTWLLMDSLGGNSKTTMIATISPASSQFDEMCNTLRYASRAKQIINTVVVNEDPSVRKVRELTAVIDRLRRSLQSAQTNKIPRSLVDELERVIVGQRTQIAELEKEVAAQRDQLRVMQTELEGAMKLHQQDSLRWQQAGGNSPPGRGSTGSGAAGSLDQPHSLLGTSAAAMQHAKGKIPAPAPATVSHDKETLRRLLDAERQRTRDLQRQLTHLSGGAIQSPRRSPEGRQNAVTTLVFQRTATPVGGGGANGTTPRPGAGAAAAGGGGGGMQTPMLHRPGSLGGASATAGTTVSSLDAHSTASSNGVPSVSAPQVKLFRTIQDLRADLESKNKKIEELQAEVRRLACNSATVLPTPRAKPHTTAAQTGKALAQTSSGGAGVPAHGAAPLSGRRSGGTGQQGGGADVALLREVTALRLRVQELEAARLASPSREFTKRKDDKIARLEAQLADERKEHERRVAELEGQQQQQQQQQIAMQREKEEDEAAKAAAAAESRNVERTVAAITKVALHERDECAAFLYAAERELREELYAADTASRRRLERVKELVAEFAAHVEASRREFSTAEEQARHAMWVQATEGTRLLHEAIRDAAARASEAEADARVEAALAAARAEHAAALEQQRASFEALMRREVSDSVRAKSEERRDCVAAVEQQLRGEQRSAVEEERARHTAEMQELRSELEALYERSARARSVERETAAALALDEARRAAVAEAEAAAATRAAMERSAHQDAMDVLRQQMSADASRAVDAARRQHAVELAAARRDAEQQLHEAEVRTIEKLAAAANEHGRKEQQLHEALAAAQEAHHAQQRTASAATAAAQRRLRDAAALQETEVEEAMQRVQLVEQCLVAPAAGLLQLHRRAAAERAAISTAERSTAVAAAGHAALAAAAEQLALDSVARAASAFLEQRRIELGGLTQLRAATAGELLNASVERAALQLAVRREERLTVLEAEACARAQLIEAAEAARGSMATAWAAWAAPSAPAAAVRLLEEKTALAALHYDDACATLEQSLKPLCRQLLEQRRRAEGQTADAASAIAALEETRRVDREAFERSREQMVEDLSELQSRELMRLRVEMQRAADAHAEEVVELREQLAALEFQLDEANLAIIQADVAMKGATTTSSRGDGVVGPRRGGSGSGYDGTGRRAHDGSQTARVPRSDEGSGANTARRWGDTLWGVLGYRSGGNASSDDKENTTGGSNRRSLTRSDTWAPARGEDIFGPLLASPRRLAAQQRQQQSPPATARSFTSSSTGLTGQQQQQQHRAALGLPGVRASKSFSVLPRGAGASRPHGAQRASRERFAGNRSPSPVRPEAALRSAVATHE